MMRIRMCNIIYFVVAKMIEKEIAPTMEPPVKK